MASPPQAQVVELDISYEAPTLTVSVEGLGVKPPVEEKVLESPDAPTPTTTGEGFGSRTSFTTAGLSLTADSGLDDGYTAETPPDLPASADALLADAAVRADQQASCRDTMLNLKEAFEGALYAQQDLEARHTLDQKRIKDLREERFQLMQALRETEDKVDAAELRVSELLASHRALSQELEESYRQHEAALAEQERLRHEKEQVLRDLEQEKATAANKAKQDALGNKEFEEKLRELEQERREKESLARARDAALEKIATMEEERASLKAQIQHERELAKDALDDERARTREIEDSFRKQLEEVSKRLEAERSEKEAILEERAKALQKVAELEKIRLSLESEKASVQKALDRVLAQCKNMQAALDKAKRSNPEALKERLAEMMRELELMNRKLGKANKDRDSALSHNAWLNGELSRKTRQNELERQFLPLIRTTRGPVGNANAKMSMTMSASEGKLQILR